LAIFPAYKVDHLINEIGISIMLGFFMLIAQYGLYLTAWPCGDFYTTGLGDVKFGIPVSKNRLKKSQGYFRQLAVKTDQGLSWLGN
jgi:hypothetical protein